jgi:hypothetical protein
MDDFKSDIFFDLLGFLVSRKHFAKAKALRLFWIPAYAEMTGEEVGTMEERRIPAFTRG